MYDQVSEYRCHVRTKLQYLSEVTEGFSCEAVPGVYLSGACNCMTRCQIMGFTWGQKPRLWHCVPKLGLGSSSQYLVVILCDGTSQEVGSTNKWCSIRKLPSAWVAWLGLTFVRPGPAAQGRTCISDKEINSFQCGFRHILWQPSLVPCPSKTLMLLFLQVGLSARSSSPRHILWQPSLVPCPSKTLPTRYPPSYVCFSDQLNQETKPEFLPFHCASDKWTHCDIISSFYLENYLVVYLHI